MTVLRGAIWDTVKFWLKVETAIMAFVFLRGLRRWTRVPLRDREQLIWLKYILVSSGNAQDWKDATAQIGS